MISALLLAAGESRRMGEPKQLLRLGHKTFVEHCVDNLLESRIDELIVVTGHLESEVRHAIGDRKVRFTHNAEYRAGMTSSIVAGLLSVSERSRACVLALVDQPRIDPLVINRIIETFDEQQPLIVIPTCQGKNGHPILLDMSLKDEILNMNSSQGLREVVHTHVSDTVRVEVLDKRVLEDCDFPADYQRMLRN